MFKPYKPVKRHLITPARVLVVCISIVGIAAVLFMIMGRNSRATHAAAPVKSAIPTSQYAFHARQAMDWRQGPTNQNSMAVFYNKGDCFISISHQTGAVDEQDQIQKAVATMRSQGNEHVIINDTPMQLKIGDTQVPYTLHQYRSSGGQSEYYRYQESAYVTDDSGYHAITGNCKEANGLDSTLDALSAVSVIRN